jgi:hypothetical protein
VDPAACDLTGTTVSLMNLLVPNPFNLTLFHLVDECWPPLYTRFDLSNDTRRSGLVRQHLQCRIPPSPPLALSVYISLQYASKVLAGFGLAGLCRRFLVWPASMVWPQNLVACTLLNTLHAEVYLEMGLKG